MRTALGITVLALAACGQGAVEVVLDLPAAEAARPTGAAQVTVRADRAVGDPVTLTAPIRDGQFDLGRLPVDDYVGFTVELRNASGAEVGYGRAGDALEVTADGTLSYHVPIRRPRSYAIGNATGVRVTDPLDGGAQTLLQVDRGARATAIERRMLDFGATQIAAGGPDVFLASGAKIFRLDSDTDTVSATPIADVGAPIRDLAADPSGAWLAAATVGGVALLDVGTGGLVPSGIAEPVDAVTFSRLSTGQLVVVALVGAVDSAAACPATSRLVVGDVPGGETSTRELTTETGLADIAGTSDLPRVVAAGYCAGQAITYDLDGLTAIGDVPGVTAPTVAVAGVTRAWVAGTLPGHTMTIDGFEYTDQAAFHQLAMVAPLDGSGEVVALPPIQQTVFTTDDETASFAQTIRAKAARVVAMIPSASGDRVTVLSDALLRNVGRSFTDTGTFPPAEVLVVPPMAVHASYAVTVADQDGVIDQIRTRCRVCAFDSSNNINELGAGCGTTLDWRYKVWQCADQAGVTVVPTDLELGAGAALFGQP